MPDFMYDHAKAERSRGNIDWENDNIDALVVMTNTTADTEREAQNLADFATLDEFTGSGYVRIDVPTRAVVEDNINHVARIDCGTLNFGALGNGLRMFQSIIIFQNNGGAALDIPLFHIDSFGAPFNPGGATETFPIDANGLFYE